MKYNDDPKTKVRDASAKVDRAIQRKLKRLRHFDEDTDDFFESKEVYKRKKHATR